ncbi:hypothetical protein APS56_11025 [Pseudalgibacter alginicilyticus]|uniref:DUF1761 domain-containing protein n=1 Tax=Pseudalgibacter alginicilyticus TaxID=1736674 RepID=A0A0P0D689_9FLAO|nr:DUF1761 domain-containing protein [Pseudalgibacter alginicilyticus]ALJ05625.1 hypothetical protein APS56_11025 [Pseudalgibacter alginicilyticus]
MEYFNPVAMFVAAVSAMVVGFIWYNPKTFGNAWMQASGMTDEKIKSGNMAKIFGLSFLFSFLLSIALPGIVIHQMGVMSLVGGDSSVALPSYEALLVDYGDAFRTFKHGAFHGVLTGVFIALPIIGINALFERKSAKYIFINAGYWIVTLAVMGAIICGWK